MTGAKRRFKGRNMEVEINRCTYIPTLHPFHSNSPIWSYVIGAVMMQLYALIIIPLLLLLFECSEWCRGQVLIRATYNLDVNSKIHLFNWKTFMSLMIKAHYLNIIVLNWMFFASKLKLWQSLSQRFRLWCVMKEIAAWQTMSRNLSAKGGYLKVNFRKFGTPRKSNGWREASCLYCWDALLDKLSTNPM